VRLWLDHSRYPSPSGADVARSDGMFADAAPAVMEKIRSYLVASTIYGSDREAEQSYAPVDRAVAAQTAGRARAAGIRKCLVKKLTLGSGIDAG
jgi:hypothetical protein